MKNQEASEFARLIGEKTKETGHVVANALKSIFDRMIDAELNITPETSGVLNKAGVVTSNKSPGEVIKGLSVIWHSLTTEKQEEIGLALAGRYHFARFLVLMDSLKVEHE